MNLNHTDKHNKRKLQEVAKKIVIPSSNLNRKKVKHVGQRVVQLIATSIDHLTF